MKARAALVLVAWLLHLAVTATAEQSWDDPAQEQTPNNNGRRLRSECPVVVCPAVCPPLKCPAPHCPPPICPALACPELHCPPMPKIPPCPIPACPEPACPQPRCPEPKCPPPTCPPPQCIQPPAAPCHACPDCRPTNVSCPPPVCPAAVCPKPHCPPLTCPEAPACPAKGATTCNGCLWKVLVTYDHFQGLGFYKGYKMRVNWHQAKVLCEADGGHLGIINSEKEAEIFKLLYQKNELGGWIFIGFHDLNEEKKFETVLGEPLSNTGYVKWRPGQPDNAGNEDCGTIDEKALLNDGRCDWKTGFICEVEERKALGQ